jgi:hypothetical protein
MSNQRDASRSSFLPAVLRELTWGKVIAAQAIAVVWHLYRYVETRYFPEMPLPASYQLSGLVIQEFTAFSLLLGTLCAREAVRRGARDWAAYPTALLIAAAFTGIAQWYVRHWLGWMVMVDINPYSPGARKWGHMLYIGIDTLVYGAFVMLAYVSRQREIHCVKLAQAVELERTDMERELARSRLAAVNARIEPHLILAQLARLKQLYEAAMPQAERELDELVQQLRARTASAALARPAPAASA